MECVGHEVHGHMNTVPEGHAFVNNMRVILPLDTVCNSGGGVLEFRPLKLVDGRRRSKFCGAPLVSPHVLRVHWRG